MLGLMKQTTEESVEEARTRLASEGKDGHVFKVIRTRVADGEARAESTTALTARDYTYRDLDEVRRSWRRPRPRPASAAPGCREGPGRASCSRSAT